MVIAPIFCRFFGPVSDPTVSGPTVGVGAELVSLPGIAGMVAAREGVSVEWRLVLAAAGAVLLAVFFNFL